MVLQIPEYHKRFLSAFFELSDEDADALFAALEKANPALTATILAQRVTPAVRITPGVLPGILLALMSLLRTRYTFDRTADEISADVVAQATEEGLIQTGEDAQVPTGLQERLARFLSLERALGITSHAVDVLASHQHPFASARILSDVRYIFSMDDAPSPAAGLIVHNLEIVAHSGGGDRTNHYFALDSLDVRTLQAVIERAILKEDALRTVIEGSDIPYVSLEP
jgi:hypothetical protein